MTVTELLMKPGRFDVKLRADTPSATRAAVREFDHIVITPSRLLPMAGFADADILDSALDTGVVTGKPDQSTITGQGLAFWLGTDDGLGDLIDTQNQQLAADLSAWIPALLPSSITAGTITDTGETLTYTFQWCTRREAIDWVCRTLGAAWRINPDGTFDAAEWGTLFPTFATAPSVVVTRRPESSEGAYRGVEVTDINAAFDATGYTTKVIVVGKSGDGAQVATGSASGSNLYKDLHNNNAVFERLVNAPTEPSANVTAMAGALLGQHGWTGWDTAISRAAITLSSDTYAVPRLVRPGELVYVWDPDAGIVDTSTQIQWRGELISPVTLQCRGYTWPIERGMGVYARRSGATPTYTDLTDYVQPDTSDTRWIVTAPYTDPNLDTSTVSPAYLGVNPDILNRVQQAAGVLKLTDNQTSTSALAAGVSTSESTTNLTTTAVATLVGRRYRITFQCELRAGQNLTSYGSARIRRGTNTSGTLVYGPVGISKRAGTASRDIVTISCYDTPGAQSAQQWVLTLQTDASSVDVYSPSSATVEDVGPA